MVYLLHQAVDKNKSSKLAGGMGKLGRGVVIYFWEFSVISTQISS